MTTRKIANQGDESIGERIDQAADRIVEIKDEIKSELKHHVANQVTARVESLEALIRQHPLAAAGIALGIGYLVARIVHR